MIRTRIMRTILTLAALVSIGCSQSDIPTQTTGGGAEASAEGAKYLLSDEPADAKGVIDARKTAEDGEELTLVGRVGGAQEPFIEGAAAFLVADESLKPCNDGCPFPWDYCCTPNLSEGKVMVKVVDGEGNPLPTDARQLLGIKELNTVVVRGRAKRDQSGNLTVLASGVHVRP